MGVYTLEEIEKKSKKEAAINRIHGISVREYKEAATKANEEFEEILRTKRYVTAAYKMLMWFGVREEDVTAERLIKAIVVLKKLISALNSAYVASKRGGEGAEGS